MCLINNPSGANPAIPLSIRELSQRTNITRGGSSASFSSRRSNNIFSSSRFTLAAKIRQPIAGKPLSTQSRERYLLEGSHHRSLPSSSPCTTHSHWTFIGHHHNVTSVILQCEEGKKTVTEAPRSQLNDRRSSLSVRNLLPLIAALCYA